MAHSVIPAPPHARAAGSEPPNHPIEPGRCRLSLDDGGAMNGRVAAWTLLGIIVIFKLGTAALILYHARPASDATYAILFATHWYLLVPFVLLIAGPAVFWYRLLRVRAKRERLHRAEWDV